MLPKLIFIIGAACSGKSSFIRAIDADDYICLDDVKPLYKIFKADELLRKNPKEFREFVVKKNVDYTVLDKVEQSHKLADFISGIWQIHPFREGNTRTVAVFTIKYLRSKGFVVDNTLFKDNSEYFRNALVRANYENVGKGIRRTTEYLYKFFDNLLLSTEYDLNTVTKVGE